MNRSKPSGGGLGFGSSSRDASDRFPWEFPKTNQGDAGTFRGECHLSLSETSPSTPIAWLALYECPNGSEIAFVTEEVGFLFAL